MPRISVVLVICLLVVEGAGGFQKTRTLRRLTASDYAEIERLYGRSFHDLSNSPDGGSAFAHHFVSNGTLVVSGRTVAGHKSLAEFAVAKRGLLHSVSNLLIEPAEDGAVGWPYVVQSNGQGLIEAGLYRDTLVKTKDGWRFGTRTYSAGTTMPQREHHIRAAANSGAALTAIDYAEIKYLIGQYNLGYDNAAPYDDGYLNSRAFTQDTLFEQLRGPVRKGRQMVATLSIHKPGFHHWDSNLLIDVSPSGEVSSFSYMLGFTVGASGTPVTTSGAGVLHHRFEKTGEGWLIKYRRYEPFGSTPTINWPTPEYGRFAAVLAANAARGEANRSDLSSVDIIEIEQLYVRSNIAFDNAADNGARYAGTFIPDGTLVRGNSSIAGQRSLAAVAAANSPGLHSWISNLTIAVAPGGAVGRVHVLSANVGDGRTQVTGIGTYDDLLVRTPNGWRFKKRVYLPVGTR